MAIQLLGKTWRTLDEPLFVNGKRVREVWANGMLVYPEDELYKNYKYHVRYEATVERHPNDLAYDIAPNQKYYVEDGGTYDVLLTRRPGSVWSWTYYLIIPRNIENYTTKFNYKIDIYSNIKPYHDEENGRPILGGVSPLVDEAEEKAHVLVSVTSEDFPPIDVIVAKSKNGDWDGLDNSDVVGSGFVSFPPARAWEYEYEAKFIYEKARSMTYRKKEELHGPTTGAVDYTQPDYKERVREYFRNEGENVNDYVRVPNSVTSDPEYDEVSGYSVPPYLSEQARENDINILFDKYRPIREVRLWDASGKSGSIVPHEGTFYSFYSSVIQNSSPIGPLNYVGFYEDGYPDTRVYNFVYEVDGRYVELSPFLYDGSILLENFELTLSEERQ